MNDRSDLPLDGPALGPDEVDDEGNEKGNDPLAPGHWTPQRKWWAAAVGVLVVNLLAGLGLDVGAFVANVAGLVGIDLDTEAAEAGVRTAIGALAGHYLWPEWLSLPEWVRELVERRLRR